MSKPKQSSRNILIGIILLSVLLRLVISLALGEAVEALPGIYDQISYHTLANRFLDGHGFTFDQQWWPITKAGESTAHWSYLYTLYLTAIYLIFGVHPLVVRMIQSILAGSLMPYFIYHIALRVFEERLEETSSTQGTFHSPISRGEGVGLLAAAWIAVYPYFLYYASALMTETFYIIGILWTLDCALRITSLLKLGKELKVKVWLELGIAIGVTTLLRQVFLIFVPFLFIWLWWSIGRQKRFRNTFFKLLFNGLFSFFIVILMIFPFTLLNYHQFGRFVLLNTNAGYAFFWANHPIHGTRFVPLFTPDMPSYQDLIPRELLNLDEAELDQVLLRRGIQFIIEDPMRFVILSFSRIPSHFMFWPSPESSLPSNLTRVFSIGVALPFMILGGILWFIDTHRGVLNVEAGSLLVLFICVYVSIHLVSWAGIRYRLPTDAVGLVFAAYPIACLLKKLMQVCHKQQATNN